MMWICFFSELLLAVSVSVFFFPPQAMQTSIPRHCATFAYLISWPSRKCKSIEMGNGIIFVVFVAGLIH